MNIVWTLILSCFANHVLAWDSEQLEVFDVVDEVKQNFYELLNISKDANGAEIRTAFRGLTLKLHPDKNLDVDTSEQFRNLVSVYEVLRSPSKRKYYDEVLVNGLPNWRSAVYYYRYVRKMGMAEVCVILFVIITIGQYIVNWAAYLEKKYTIQEQLKRRKTSRKSNLKEEPEIILPKPSFYNTLPIQIPRLIWYSIISVPSALGMIKALVAQQIEEAIKPPPPEPEPEPPKIKTVRKRNKFVVPEGPNFNVQTNNNSNITSNGTTSPPPMTGGLWTDDDLAELIRLVKKYPQGAPKRWESIAEALNRAVPEVTYMANKMKENGYKVPSEQEEDTPQVKVKQKTKKDMDAGEEVKKWSQTQQKTLEDALAKYPKGCTDRWDRISDCVAGKTKEECMLRFKYLADILKKQRIEKPGSEEHTE